MVETTKDSWDKQAFDSERIESHSLDTLYALEEMNDYAVLKRKIFLLEEISVFIKKLKIQSDLYAYKTNSLVRTLFRDSIIACLLTYIIIFTNISEIFAIDRVKLLSFFCDILSVYFIVSIACRSFKSIINIIESKNELLYWRDSARQLLTRIQYVVYIERSLNGMRRGLYIIYPLVILIYLSVAFSFYKVPDYCKNMKPLQYNDKIYYLTTKS